MQNTTGQNDFVGVLKVTGQDPEPDQDPLVR